MERGKATREQELHEMYKKQMGGGDAKTVEQDESLRWDIQEDKDDPISYIQDRIKTLTLNQEMPFAEKTSRIETLKRMAQKLWAEKLRRDNAEEQEQGRYGVMPQLNEGSKWAPQIDWGKIYGSPAFRGR